jgi:hypothetical protein
VKKKLLIAAAALLLAACRTARVDEAPLQAQPLESLHAIRTLVRVRATNGERTESFKAQMIVEPATQRIELTAYTPVGTSAMTLFADGDRVTFLDHVNRTSWEGSAQSLDLFGGATPAAWALAIDGYPSTNTAVAYDAATRRATIRRGAGTIEVTTLEAYSSGASPHGPSIPRDYQCCVAPKL